MEILTISAHTLTHGTVPTIFIVVGNEEHTVIVFAIKRILLAQIIINLINRLVSFRNIIHKVMQFPAITHVKSFCMKLGTFRFG